MLYSNSQEFSTLYSIHTDFKGDFEGKGGFCAFWKKQFEEVQKYRSDIGSVPYCMHSDPDSDRKIRENDNFCPYDHYNDCLSLVYYYVTEALSLRG